jgi:type IV pilus assembly protein PilA
LGRNKILDCKEIFPNMRKQKGFSLIELLIVVAIILIIAAIAIPNLLRSRIAANESAAAATVRTMNTTEVTYSTTYPASGYAPDLKTLGPNGSTCATPTSTAACLIDGTLGCATAPCVKGGYQYTVSSTAAAIPYPDYIIVATPIGLTSGTKDMCSNADAVVHVNGPLTAAPTTASTITPAICQGYPAL